ncbi:MAG: hypothetical protein HZC54_21525 [Verrucomicrobia bacterium]|nr:hypothetical protein [Verrucomicrobiota bacterium]
MKLKVDFFRMGIMSSFHGLGEFLQTVEAQLEEAKHLELGRLRAEYQTVEVNNHEDEMSLVGEMHAELQIVERQFEETFTFTLRYSFVVSLFGLVETQLRAVCDKISEQKYLNLHLGDLSGRNLLDRTNKFLEKVAGLRGIPAEKCEVIIDLQKVRDCIVHSNGRVALSRDKQHIRHLCTRRTGLSLVEADLGLHAYAGIGGSGAEELLIIERSFCYEQLKAIQTIFADLFEQAGCFGPDHVDVTP